MLRSFFGMLQSVQQPASEIRRDRRAAIDDLQHSLGKVAKPGVFDQIARSAQLKSMQRMLLVFHSRNNHCLRQRTHCFQVFDQVQTTAVAKIQVNQQNFKFMLLNQTPALTQTCALRHQINSEVGKQLMRNDFAHVDVIVNKNYPYWLARLPR